MKYFHHIRRRFTKKRLFHAALITTAALIVTFGIFVVITLSNLPSLALLENRHITESTKIYDRTGTALLFEVFDEERRTVIPYDKIPDHVKQATIAIEDSEFYEHSAIDFSSLLRALWVNFKSGQIVQGGSTITQQLAKKAFLSDERTWTRKFKEAIIAYKLEQTFTKDEILALYLNQIPYGANAYGIESAAQTFFQKSITDVTLAEAALLVSLPQAPSYYSPYGSHVKELLDRKDIVLEQMELQGYITKEERMEAERIQLTFSPLRNLRQAPHFAIEVREYLEEKYGEDFVRRSGLRVTTTLDKDLQLAAEKAVAAGAKRNTELYKGTNAALVAQDAKTGQILAMVGSRDYYSTTTVDGNFNVATQGLRQPGSALKPFAYLTALSMGYPAETIYFDVRTEFNTSRNTDMDYHPDNFDGKFRGLVSMRNALAQSVNIPAVKTLYLIGIDNLLNTLHSFGITTLNDPRRYGLSLVLGGGEVRLIDLVGAYSVLAQEGVRHDQQIIVKIENRDGEVLEEYKDRAELVIDPQYPRIINDILSDVGARSALFSSSLGLTVFPGHDVAIKTGTTNDYRDAWAIGYTPGLVAGVWAGNNNNDPMKSQGGSILAAIPILNGFLVEALPKQAPEPFKVPEYTKSNKPLLNGQLYSTDPDFPTNEVHDILHYVNKRDPLGPYPTNPASDPQYRNWEAGVSRWINQGGFVPAPQPALGDATVKIITPAPDSQLQSPTTIEAEIDSEERVVKIELFFNGVLVDSQTDNFGRNTTYRNVFTPAEIRPQNIIKIVATDRDDAVFSAEVVVTQ